MEDKDIKILEDMIEKSRELYEEEFYKLIDIGKIQRISDLLKAYKKDEKVIEEMAKELRMRQYNCYGKSIKTIIEHFRKKCE